MGRPFFLIYLSPLIIEIAILLSLASGFVSLYQGSSLGRFSSYGFPFSWRVLVCEVIPCGVVINWPAFWLDAVFYVAVQYVSVVVVGVHIGRLPRPPSLRELFGRNTLGIAFQLALTGATLMVIVPLLTFTVEPGGPVCLVPSPCLTQLMNWRSAWMLMMEIWVFSGAIAFFVVVMLGFLAKIGGRLLGAFLAVLSVIHMSGLWVFLTSGVIVFLDISQEMVPVIAAAVSIGPLLAFLAGLRLNDGQRIIPAAIGK